MKDALLGLLISINDQVRAVTKDIPSEWVQIVTLRQYVIEVRHPEGEMN